MRSSQAAGTVSLRRRRQQLKPDQFQSENLSKFPSIWSVIIFRSWSSSLLKRLCPEYKLSRLRRANGETAGSDLVTVRLNWASIALLGSMEAKTTFSKNSNWFSFHYLQKTAHLNGLETQFCLKSCETLKSGHSVKGDCCWSIHPSRLFAASTKIPLIPDSLQIFRNSASFKA